VSRYHQTLTSDHNSIALDISVVGRRNSYIPSSFSAIIFWLWLRAEQLCTHSVQSYAETSKNTKSSERFTVEKKEQNVNNITE